MVCLAGSGTAGLSPRRTENSNSAVSSGQVGGRWAREQVGIRCRVGSRLDGAMSGKRSRATLPGEMARVIRPAADSWCAFMALFVKVLEEETESALLLYAGRLTGSVVQHALLSLFGIPRRLLGPVRREVRASVFAVRWLFFWL